jgi:hypothetical protein
MAVIEAYAKLVWSPGDIQSLRPDWDIPRCRRFLENNQNQIRDRLCEIGWDVIETFLSLEGDDECKSS